MIDISEIAEAVESSFNGEHLYYFDQQTGNVLFIEADLLRAVEDKDEKTLENFPSWKKEFIEHTRLILSDVKNRYVAIPVLESWKAYAHLEAFLNTVTDETLREKLEIAMDGSERFSRFRHVLDHYPEERQRWFAFKEAKIAEEVRLFLLSIDIELTAEESP